MKSGGIWVWFCTVSHSSTPPPLQVKSLGETAERLMQSHPEAADDITEKRSELNTAWTSLVGRADQRKERLGNSHDLQRFLSDFRYRERERERVGD